MMNSNGNVYDTQGSVICIGGRVNAGTPIQRWATLLDVCFPLHDEPVNVEDDEESQDGDLSDAEDG
jgi:hypothetical protein